MKSKEDALLQLMYMEFGNLLLEFDSQDQATRFLTQSLELAQRNQDLHGTRRALQSLGKILLRRGRFREAERLFSQCLEMHEDDNPGYDILPLIGLLELYRFTGRSGEAEQAVERARALLPENTAMLPYVEAAAAGLLMDAGRYQETIGLIDRAFEEFPHETRGEIWLELQARRSWCRHKIGDSQEAVSGLEEALAQAVDKDAPYRESEMHALLALAHTDAGRSDDAVSHARMAVNRATAAHSEPCMTLAADALARALAGSGQVEQAAEYLKYSLSMSRRVQQHQDVCAALLDMARLRLDDEDHRNAAIYASRLLQYADPNLAPLRIGAMLVMARSYLGRGMPHDAASLARAALRRARDCNDAQLSQQAQQVLDELD